MKTLNAAQRRRLLASMPEELQKVAKELEETKNKNYANNLLVTWDIGQRFVQVQSDPDAYGARAVEQLAKVMTFSSSHAYALSNLASSFSRSVVGNLAKRRMRNGEQISLSHFNVLGAVDDPAKRAELTEKIFQESLSARSLLHEAEAAGLVKASSTRGGSKPKKPTTVLTGLVEIIAKTTALNSRFEGWGTAVFAEITQAPPATLDTVVLARLKLADEQLSNLIKNAAAARAAIAQNVKRVEKVIANRTQKAKEAEDAGKSGREVIDDPFEDAAA